MNKWLTPLVRTDPFDLRSRWQTLGSPVPPLRYIGDTYQDEVNWLKEWIKGRLAWIDSQDFPKPVTQITKDADSRRLKLAMKCLAGRIFYTADGTDPRLRGGTVSPAAREYREPFPFGTNVVITARVRSDIGLWSAPVRVKGSDLQ